MSIYPLAKAHEKLPKLFEQIRKARLPKRFTYRFLMEIGFSSSQERELLPILKQLGFLARNGQPTIYYNKLKNPREFQTVLQERIKETYDEVFRLDKNIPGVEEETLAGYFSQLTGQDYDLCRLYAKTFLALCKYSEISQEQSQSQRRDQDIVASQESAKITFNIHLPNTRDEKVYQAIFKNLRDYLIR
jgi:hypothetical protein